jgi:hypothetical protein
MRSYLAAASVLASIWFAPVAGAQEPKSAAGSPGDLAETGKRLSNPLSDVWALFSRFDANFADGDANPGDPKVGGRMLFQPILPVPLHGTGANRWNFIARPTIPVLFSEPVPSGLNSFNHTGGMGDIELPTVIAPPAGNWILGAGPAFLFPTATNDAFGRDQWGVGPALVVGYGLKQSPSARLASTTSGSVPPAPVSQASRTPVI